MDINIHMLNKDNKEYVLQSDSTETEFQLFFSGHSTQAFPVQLPLRLECSQWKTCNLA